ncbi:unnamed protein product [Lactuca virosa]|uniref:t-SNARE coiled-coil homology domain-containing protein n=1 Tax=Lactuca virosa TaxID=75947 RepID=A0AAU9M7P5_9ASTR|nr:unnamed protein product [Lactuca virosa]
MPSTASSRNNRSFEDRRHFPANGSIADQRELRESLCREMDSMNREVDDVRASVLEMSHLIDDLRNHFYSLQTAYVSASNDIVKMKKMLIVTSLFGVVTVAGVVADYKWF